MPEDPDYAAVPTETLPPIAKLIDGELTEIADDVEFVLVVVSPSGISTVGTLCAHRRIEVLQNVVDGLVEGDCFDAGTYDAKSLERLPSDKEEIN